MNIGIPSNSHAVASGYAWRCLLDPRPGMLLFKGLEERGWADSEMVIYCGK